MKNSSILVYKSYILTMMSDWLIKSGMVIFLICAFFSETLASDYSNPVAREYNVILISIDTLRADHLGCYGYFRDTSPNIDKFARESVLFENAFSQATVTGSSHACIFTSRYVANHDVRMDGDKLMDYSLTLAEVLKNYGYKTAAFTGKAYLSHKFGLNQGFDIYYDNGEGDVLTMGSFKKSVPLSLEWLSKNKNNKFFLFVHGYDVHMPFDHPEQYMHFFDAGYTGTVDSSGGYKYLRENIYKGYYISNDNKLQELTEKDKNHLIAHYDGGIRYADFLMGEFFKKLSEFDLLNNTIIIIFSDHGEELFDHGHIFMHGRNYYDEVLHVPLIIKHPGFKKSLKIKEQVELVDIMPTLLDFLNIPIPNTVQGKSLKNLIQVVNEERQIQSPQESFIYSGFDVIRTSEWKLLGRSLYNLKEDPKELRDVAAEEPAIYLKLYKKLRQWWIKLKDLKHQDKDLIEQVKKLGYW